MHGTKKSDEKSTNEGDFHLFEVFFCLSGVILSLALSDVDSRYSYF